MNLTDNEIIKALENCGNVGECQKCPLNEMGQGISLCIPHLTQNALDLIKRKQAVNELQAKEIVDLKIKVKEQRQRLRG